MSDRGRVRRLSAWLSADTFYRISLLIIAGVSLALILFGLLGITAVIVIAGRLLIAYLCLMLLARHVGHRDVGH